MYVRRIGVDQLSLRQWLTIMSTIGVVIGGFVAAAGSYVYFERSSNAARWTPAQATISGMSELCHMSRRSGKRWVFVEAIDCPNVEAYIAANAERKWKSANVAYVTIDYAAEGTAKQQLVPEFRVSTTPVAVGQTVPIFVNPADGNVFDRPVADADVESVMVTVYIGLAIAAGLALFGALLGWLSERKRRNLAAASR